MKLTTDYALPRSTHGVRLDGDGNRFGPPGFGRSSLPVTFNVESLSATPDSLGSVIWESRYVGAESRTTYTLFHRPSRYVLRVECQGNGFFEYQSDTIRIHWEAGGTGPQHYLLGIGLAFALELKGFPCLHAGAIAIGGKAIGILGRARRASRRSWLR